MLKEQQDDAYEKRIDGLIDVVAMQRKTINNLQEEIKQLQNQ